MSKTDKIKYDAEVMRLIKAYAADSKVSVACVVREIITCDCDFKSFCGEQVVNDEETEEPGFWDSLLG